MGSAISSDLEKITEDDLKNLERDEIPEGLRLEFKAEVNVNKPDWTSEVAKDVTALANTDGGRLFYGIEQKVLPDGRTVAGPIKPLIDQRLEDQIRDAVVGNSHPRPRFRTHDVPVEGGIVKIVEVYASFGQDLHMVSGKRELRFYRRNASGTYPMTEPEIREAYARIAISQARLDETIEVGLAREVALRPGAEESVFVVPWYSRPNLVEPRLFPQFHIDLQQGLLRDSSLSSLAHLCRLGGDGFVAEERNTDAPIAQHFLAVRKSGLIHYSRAQTCAPRQGPRTYFLTIGAESIFDALLLAKIVYDRASYWGPVRLLYVLSFDQKVELRAFRYGGHFPRSIPGGTYRHVVPNADLTEAGSNIGPIIREALDQVCHHGGWVGCPWFDEAGRLTSPPDELSERLKSALGVKPSK